MLLIKFNSTDILNINRNTNLNKSYINNNLSINWVFVTRYGRVLLMKDADDVCCVVLLDLNLQ